MATTRLREKSPKKPAVDNEDIGSPTTRSTRQRTKKIKPETEENCEDSNDPEYASLNVLAQVATETLEKEPKSASKGTKKLTKRSIQTLESLDLDQIKRLSDKCLLSFFSEFSANEMTRNFTYSCQLIPKRCKESFKSFGNENQARIKIKTHLKDHLTQLTEEEKKAGKKTAKFTAEPLHIRNKRIADMAGKVKKKSSPNFNIANVLLGSSANKKNNFTNLKSNPNTESVEKDSETENDEALINSQIESSENPDDEHHELISDDENGNNVTKKRETKRSKRQKKSAHSVSENESSKNQSERESKRIMAKRKKSKKKTYMSSDDESDNSLKDETERRIEENEQFIIDLLSRTQPHHDHCYTTIFGRKKGLESIDIIDENDDLQNDNSDDNNPWFQGKEIIYPDKKAEPILCLGNVSVMDELTGTGSDEASKTIIVCSEEILNDNEDDEVLDGHTGQRPYPPMPKLLVSKRGRIAYPEEDEPVSEEEQVVVTPSKKKKKERSATGDNIAAGDWERKMALKCIRELKSRKTREDALLFCKICKDKKFTASATLMYHYRSHAGIKPFVCLICNTTFTRQHSLNYHMLIHNNQSRFTCKDCGRKFRHPSHFKEHLRRHTGETPFICMDCPQKFKTRNTYKRHLKTRHGKLLTAAGIRMLSVEEFARIRTKPYRRTPDRYLKSKGKNVTVIMPDQQNNSYTDNDSDHSRENVSVIENQEYEDHDLHADEQYEGAEEIMPQGEDGDSEEAPVLQNNSLFVPVGIIVNS